MKNWQQITLVLFFLGLGSTLFAQDGRMGMDPAKQAAKQLEAMKERLTLSDVQAEKVEVVLLASADKMKTARKEADGDRSAMRSSIMKIREEQNAEMKKYLTEEQFTGYLEMEKEERDRRRKRMRGGKKASKDKEDKS